ncbi:MAG: hypothetical protein H7Z38_18405 [Rubrivivax sp.]|nr:hypothetical protein [Pyrinomonadaceae bacterium]
MRVRNAITLALFVLLCAGNSLGRQAGGESVQRLSLPGKDWALEMSLPGFNVGEIETSPNGRARRFYADIKEQGYNFSVAISPAAQEGDSKFLRDLSVKSLGNSPFKMDDLKQSEYKQLPTIEYLIKEFRGQRVNQKHFNAYIARDGAWIDIHLSKIPFKDGDEKLFYAILDSIKFVPAGAASAEEQSAADARAKVMGLMREGSANFIGNDYRAAIGPYRQALELEKTNPRLDKNLWRVLIDNLGMAYGITGDTKTAKETFEYGLSKDPDYPMFHYLMACTYAETNDLDNAILYLKQAFARKQNIIPGERMPDPSTDDSFKRFQKDEKFRAALKEINR